MHLSHPGYPYVDYWSGRNQRDAFRHQYTLRSLGTWEAGIEEGSIAGVSWKVQYNCRLVFHTKLQKSVQALKTITSLFSVRESTVTSHEKTGKEVEWLLNITLQSKVNKTQANAVWCLLSSMWWGSRCTFMQTLVKKSKRKKKERLNYPYFGYVCHLSCCLGDKNRTNVALKRSSSNKRDKSK